MPLIRSRLKTILIAFTITLTLSIIYSANAFTNYEKDLEDRLKSKQFLNPTVFYASPIALKKGFILPRESLSTYFARQNFRERQKDQRIMDGDYFYGKREDCLSMAPEITSEYQSCLFFAKKYHSSSSESVAERDISVFQVFMDPDYRILEIHSNTPPTAPEIIEMDPEILAQYLSTEPIMQEAVEIKDLPTNCPNAIMAIEDADFLEHKGYSIKGTVRGILAPLLKGKKPQGGSTITQQLVKNYFLTNERTVRRKAEEFILSVLIEKKMTKDEILETYMNVIYMGQNGPFQIIGYGAASQYYFDKKISDLRLDECALLAAVLNGPGVYHPFNKPEKTMTRRNLVLSKMQQLKLISDTEYEEAIQKPMPKKRTSQASETAPYYLDAVRKQLKKLNIPAEGTRIQTGLNLELQQKAQESLQAHLASLEKDNKKLADNKTKGLSLEGVVLSTEHQTGMVDVLVGGRSFRMTQFNRATEGHRQVGSIFKPLVYLTALEKIKTEEGFVSPPTGLGKIFSSYRPFTPMTPLKDEPFVWTMNKRKWSPENYAKKFFGSVPFYYALKNSLNASTAMLGQTVGLEDIIANAKKLGAYSDLKPFPSLTLGAFEMYPVEVLQIYSTLANIGKKVNLSFIKRVYNFKNELLFEHKPSPEVVVDDVITSILLGVMKQTPISGTAKSLASAGFDIPIAGKTGTTNDYKDTWFIGMTPLKTSLVWVGYDQNGVTGLTGGSGAVPVWAQFMKSALKNHPKIDFFFPEDKIQRVIIDKDKLTKMNLNVDLEPDLAPFELIFDKEKVPPELN
ncbi:MAG: transglycosylase domain-containing protein [Bdellovibrionaceae bacterium]|nr:transglycosylase domain-containing protein [Pseudobdellovibrionaceae bacterium]